MEDYGKGIAPELLRSFRTKGTNSGVGLAGMRERMRELGGQLSIQPCSPGTMISVTMPASESADQSDVAAARLRVSSEVSFFPQECSHRHPTTQPISAFAQVPRIPALRPRQKAAWRGTGSPSGWAFPARVA